MRDDVVGSEVPRLFPAPLRELTPETSLGFECCDFLENICGWSLPVSYTHLTLPTSDLV